MLILLLACCLNAPLEVVVNTEGITLGQVIPLPGTDPRSAIPLGYAPNPGLARRVPRQELTGRIQAAGFTADDLQFPESILVRRRSVALDAQQVRQAIFTAFAKQYPTANIELLGVDMPATEVGTEDVSISAGLPSRFDPAQPVFVRLDVRSGGSSRTIFARTTVKIETMQPVIREHVAANSELKPGDVEWKPSPLDNSGAVPASLDGLSGMLAKRDLEPGQILRTDLFYMPLYVRRGETVTVKAVSGSVTDRKSVV